MKQDLGLMYGEQNLDLMYSMMIIVNNIVSYTSKLFSSNLYVCVCVCVCVYTHTYTTFIKPTLLYLKLTQCYNDICQLYLSKVENNFKSENFKSISFVSGAGGPRGRGHVYTYGRFMLMCGRNQHNIVKQLSFN